MVKNQGLQFVCLGNVLEGEDELYKTAQQLGVAERIQLHARIPYEQVFDHLSDASVGLILYQPGIRNHEYSLPMKLFDYMVAGVPVIAPNASVWVNQIVSDEQCGLLVDTSNPVEIANALDWICTHTEQAIEMGRRGQHAVLTKYNWQNEAHKLIEAYKQLLTPSSI
jgi:glycosyltransferase involved in cell wall biosynthesis